MISYVKLLRIQLFHFLSGSGKKEPGVRVTTEGIPKAFGRLMIEEIRQLRSEATILPILTTILFSTRALSPKMVVSTESITAPGFQGIWLPEFDRYLPSF